MYVLAYVNAAFEILLLRRGRYLAFGRVVLGCDGGIQHRREIPLPEVLSLPRSRPRRTFLTSAKTTPFLSLFPKVRLGTHEAASVHRGLQGKGFRPPGERQKRKKGNSAECFPPFSFRFLPKIPLWGVFVSLATVATSCICIRFVCRGSIHLFPPPTSHLTYKSSCFAFNWIPLFSPFCRYRSWTSTTLRTASSPRATPASSCSRCQGTRARTS